MSDENLSDSFWVGGAADYASALRKEHDQHILQLQSRLNAANEETDREQIQSEMKLAEAAFQSKLDGIDDALF